MAEQNYANHARIDTGYHRILLLVQLACLTGSGVNLWRAWPDHAVRYSASLLAAAFLVIFVVSIYARLFALKAQDRAIRAEENLRHFALTGKLLDARLSVKQIVALRFAPDEEFVDLARKAAAEGLAPDAIKRAIRNWRPDHDRV